MSIGTSARLLIHPLPESRGTALLKALEGFDDDFVRLLEEDRFDRLPIQERDEF